jgi:hypothetical protein
MSMDDARKLPQLRFGTGWTVVRIADGPICVPTQRGYAVALIVTNEINALVQLWFVSAKSIQDQLEPLRKASATGLVGMRLRVRKAGEEPTSPYEIVQDG